MRRMQRVGPVLEPEPRDQTGTEHNRDWGADQARPGGGAAWTGSRLRACARTRMGSATAHDRSIFRAARKRPDESGQGMAVMRESAADNRHVALSSRRDTEASERARTLRRGETQRPHLLLLVPALALVATGGGAIDMLASLASS